MGALAVLMVWLLLSIVAAIATAWWSRRLWRRRRELPAGARRIAVVAIVSAAFGALGTVIGLITAFGAVGGESSDPSQKARILAEGISAAMNATALGIAVWVPSAIAVFILSKQRGARRE